MYNHGDEPNKGIGEWLIFFILSACWSFYEFGWSFKSLFVTWGIITGSIVFALIVTYLADKFKD